MQRTGTPALPARPARAPRGFVAADRCQVCEGRGQVLALVDAPDGGLAGELVDGVLVEAREVVTCDDCTGAGWVKPVAETTTPAQRRAERIAAHQADGPGPSCGGWWCQH
jgi:hypothetical protein